MAIDARQRRGARKAPLTVQRITDAALDVVASQGYDALSMRSVAAVLDTGPASLYAHVVNKGDLDELIIGRLCAGIALPLPDAAHWREQIIDVCTQLRDQYLAYPGVSRAALAMEVTDLDILRVNEAMLAILVEGGVDPQSAAWAIDALFLYVGAYALEASIVAPAEPDAEDWRVSPADRDALIRRFRALPTDRFPHITRYAEQLTSGVRHERFDFTLRLMIDNLA
ncbi:MAG: TetR/AcrR family transcriptional regulator C-terminal domain-containing protein [Microbacterium sp.]|uniref:TetR/AcrR family transcriptional regulator n=1 Tax=Microbacterium sp. TaxID=51671 RepID=UPI001AC2FD17|nr:TetR/AcrR family transcriptional regulator [Microbacterium sp.]MBN9153292.1 TetR/AcrR family transcriptional regulator C-terminal domain-containing protein [Microbacterium sp.]MBN9175635.1 TetR/AcrR family transcriptional regulator C-terminal domain-containing protein [Microbacterium sp.]